MPTTFNRITTGTVRRRDGWHITIRYHHTDHNDSRSEESRRAFSSEANAKEMARSLAVQIAEGLHGAG